jgi:zinc protease
MQRAGALLNGSTNADRTNYWEVVPTGALELALWMESDRMGYLLPALSEAKFNNQRDVVLNERRQNNENKPYGLAGMAISSTLYPPDHPYHWPTIGSADDIRAATIDLVRDFFQTYYHPRNASLAIAGDVETERAFDLVEQHFGELAPGPEIERLRINSSLNEDVNIVLEDRIELPRLYVTWHSPAMFAAGDAELDIAADVLSHGKTSRLYKSLVYERRIATDVAAFQSSREMAGVFQISCTAAAGVTLSELHTAIIAAVGELATQGPTDAELERGLAQTEAAFVYRLQTIGGFGGKSDQLNAYNTFVGDPGYFGADRQRYFDVTSKAAAAAVAKYLANAPSVTLSVVPKGKRELAMPGAVEVTVS